MKKISMKGAMASGAWYECRAKEFDETFQFRFRVLGFERTTVDELDPSDEHCVAVEGILWLLTIEAVNLNKKPIFSTQLPSLMRVVDEDGFEFEAFTSDLNSVDGGPLFRFSGWCNVPLSPKIKAVGAVAFVLPDEDSNYYLAFIEGNIKEA